MTVRDFESRQPTIADSAYIDATALVIGDVTIGADVSLWPMVVARGDIHSIQIGARSNIQDGSILHVTHDGPFAPQGYGLTIGKSVTVGHKAILHGCTIGDHCLIGMGTTIMDGAYLEPQTMVGAGSLVTPGKHLQSGYLWMGTPARQVRTLRAEELDFLNYSADFYVELKNRHRAAPRSRNAV